MFEERFMIGQPVKDLQYMLWVLSQIYPSLPFVTMDGVFGEETLEGVMTFQREFFPPVTGRVDQRTWDALVEKTRRAEYVLGRPRRLYGFPDRPFLVRPGEQAETMALVQVLFQSLGQQLEGVAEDPADVIHGNASAGNIRWLQGRSGQPQTGIMDRGTWDMLSRLYDLFVVRRKGLPGA